MELIISVMIAKLDRGLGGSKPCFDKLYPFNPIATVLASDFVIAVMVESV
jgi:hypothetical protein